MVQARAQKLPHRRFRACRQLVLTLAFTGVFGGSAWLGTPAPTQPNQQLNSRRSTLFGSSASILAPFLVAPSQAEAFGPVTMPMSNIRYEEVTCNPKKGEMLKGGAKGAIGLAARCVQVTATVTNPENKELTRAGVFGRINDAKEETSVLANAFDGASDVGQLTLVDKITPGKTDVTFRFVAVVPKKQEKSPLPELEFKSMKAIWYPGGRRFEPIADCTEDRTQEGCDE